MTDRIGSIIINSWLVKLRNRTTITRVPRLDPGDFESQTDSPGLVQKLPGNIAVKQTR